MLSGISQDLLPPVAQLWKVDVGRYSAHAASGRQDLNLRPPGPQPGALPDCATPRDPSILRSLPAGAVCTVCEHMFVQDESQQRRRCGRCGHSKPIAEFVWHRKAKGQRDNYCRPCRAAYKQEHYAAHRERYVANASRRKRALIAERTAYLIEFFRERPVRRLRRGRPPGAGVRPHRPQELQYLRGHPRSQMAVGTRRDRAMRCGLCELPSSPNSASSWVCSCLSPKSGLSATDANKRATGIEPVLKAWKAFVQPKHFARTPSLNPTAASRLPAAPPPAPPPPRPPTRAAAKARTSCPGPRRASRSTR